MNRALEAHLMRMFALSLKAQALADALNALVDDAEYQDTSIQMAMALSSITSTIAAGLDTPQRFEVAA
ncbi:hypothetical protein [Paracoccus sp. (in: a-proteobacteria)]|uniref:hypothetical protein n=1 Tax=Paracoccus sp. TaxID=267 RepID=UPI0028AFE881|nr:hypothetical protein [Paracoccus sp. (in: a-proteobacteria)]